MPDADFQYEVMGRWPFPVDMLRYDDARPLTDADLATVVSLSGDQAPDEGNLSTVHTVKLLIPEAGRRRPRTEPWESFGWTVPGDEGRKADLAERERAATREGHLRSALAKLSPEEVEAIEWNVGRKLGL